MRHLTLLALPLLLITSPCFCQTQNHTDSSNMEEAPLPLPSPSPKSRSAASKFGIAVSASTLGAGIQAAAAVSGSENVRVGFNYFKYSHDFDKDGITYKGTLKLQSAEILFDQYLGKVIHISSGLMFYDGNKGSGNANVPGGQSFTLGGTTYFSDSASPVTGTGSIQARKTSPEFLIGFGNLVPRNGKHLGANFEFGVALQGSPQATLQLSGNTCVTQGSGCLSIGSNPVAQASVKAEQDKINNSLSVFKYYPIVRFSIGYSF